MKALGTNIGLSTRSWIVGDPEASQKKRASRKFAGFVSTSLSAVSEAPPERSAGS